MKKFTFVVFFLVFYFLSPVLVLAQGAFSGSTTGKLAVTPPGYDDIGDVLQNLGYDSTEITEADLANSTKLAGFDSVYINCSESADNQLGAAASALKSYVQNGGILYASDWANGLIEAAFPGKISFYKGDTGGGYEEDDAYGRVGDDGTVTARVLDPGLISVLGKTNIEVTYDLPYWVIIDSVASDVKVHMSGPAMAIGATGESSSLGDKPYVVSFSEGEGEVLYTTFHNEAQTSSDVESVLEWFAVRVRAGKLVQESRETGTQESNLILKEIVDGIDQDETRTYEFNATGTDDFNIILNFESGKLHLTVTDPSGDKVVDETISSGPFTKEVKAEEGTYTIDVIGDDVSETHMPFVLSISGPEGASGEETGPLTDTTKSPIVKFIDDNKTLLIVSVAVLCGMCTLGIGLVAFLLLRKK